MSSLENLIKQDGSPFKKGRRRFGAKPKFTQISSLSTDKVIRSEAPRTIIERINTGDIYEAAKKLKGMFQELKDIYGINVVPIDFILGREDRNRMLLGTHKNKERLFFITEKVHGIGFDDDPRVDDIWIGRLSEQERKELAAEFYNLVHSLFNYLVDNFNSHSEYILWDIPKIRQYVWGITKNDPNKKHLYLVDIGSENIDSVKKCKKCRLYFLEDLYRTIEDYGLKFRLNLSELKDKLIKLSAQMSV